MPSQIRRIERAIHAMLTVLGLTAGLSACDTVSGPERMASTVSGSPTKANSQEFASPTMGSSILFGGLRHRAIRGAILSEGPDGLTISNIGSSGQDGVCIDLGFATGISNRFVAIDLTQTGVSWMLRTQSESETRALWFSLDPGSDGIEISVRQLGLGASLLGLELYQSGSRVHDEAGGPLSLASLRIENGAQLVGSTLTGSSVAAAVVSAGLVLASPVGVECSAGHIVQADEIRMIVGVEAGPLFPGAWEQLTRFAPKANGKLSELVLAASALYHDGLTFTGLSSTAVSVPRPGSGVRVIGTGDPVHPTSVVVSAAAAAAWSATNPNANFGPLAIRGIDLNSNGESWQVEIEGVNQGAKAANALVINLSLGWSPEGLMVAGDYPSGNGSAAVQVYASCHGALVLAAFSPDAQGIAAFGSAMGYAGFRVDSVAFDARDSSLDILGRALHATGGSHPAHIRIEPVEPIVMATPADLTMRYVPSATAVDWASWFVAAKQPDSRERDPQMSIHQ